MINEIKDAASKSGGDLIFCLKAKDGEAIIWCILLVAYTILSFATEFVILDAVIFPVVILLILWQAKDTRERIEDQL